ncbi:MAG: HD domain-containing protein [Chlamydiales bacterium]|nr:HD domain-containing protein [Chlamydiales bacterium]
MTEFTTTKAALSEHYHARREEAPDSYRTPYRRDADRILHSKAYARYVDKTQVVYLVANDHISHRSLHVQLVSSLSRGIAEVLQLNLPLVEAIALGHDVGHPPFGHEGEGYLSKISQQLGQGFFAHPWQSCRLLSLIEPLNLGLAVYDGILCHDAGLASNVITPRWNKSWDDHRTDLALRLRDPEANIIPGTLEGCLVKICDTISYLSRDLEDAISLNIITRDQVPHTLLSNTSQEILRRFAQDIIACSKGQNYVAMSEQMYESVATLRRFNFDFIYFDPRLKSESQKIQRGYAHLVDFLLDDLKQKGQDSYIWKDFLHNKESEYFADAPPERQVIDYVAGMTDGFFLRTLQKIFVPSPIGWP